MEQKPSSFALHASLTFFDQENTPTAKENLSDFVLWLTGSLNKNTGCIDFFGNANPDQSITQIPLEEDLWIHFAYDLDIDIGDDCSTFFVRLLESHLNHIEKTRGYRDKKRAKNEEEKTVKLICDSFFKIGDKDTKSFPVNYFWKRVNQSKLVLDHIEFSIPKEEWNKQMTFIIDKMNIMKSKDKTKLLI